MIENFPEEPDQQSNKESLAERWPANVVVRLKFTRHGKRDTDGNLLDAGREETRRVAHESEEGDREYDAVKAVGSTAGPKNDDGYARSTETADIYAHEIAGHDQFTTRTDPLLSYETMKTKFPFDAKEMEKSFLPDSIDLLSEDEKNAALKKAQQKVMDHLVALDTPEATTFKREAAGAFAKIIEHYIKLAKRVKPDSRVLFVLGTHTGVMEFLLQQGLSQNVDDERKEGIESFSEIGGTFATSESYNVDIETDEEGNLKPLKVTFDREGRPTHDMYIDIAKLAELSDDYGGIQPASN